MGRVVLLCGESPLPVWVAALTLNAHDVVLLHGDGSSDKAAQAVSTALVARRLKVVTFPVSPFDPASTQRQLREHADRLLVGRSLVYGPGTSAMNVAAYGAWLLANVDHPDTDAWWPESRTGMLHSLMGRTVPFAASGLDLESIAGLHDPFSTVGRGADLKEAIAALGRHDLGAMSQLVERWLNDPTQSTTKARKSLPGPLKGLAGSNHDSGWLLELGVGLLLTRWLTEVGGTPDEICLNAVAHVDGGQIAEFDVALRWGERVLCVTCGKASTFSALRHKLFEVDSRGPQVFGRETRTLTVAHAREDIARSWGDGHDSLNGIWQRRRRRLGVTWDSRPRHAIVAARELFGPRPSTCLTRPEAIFDEHNEAVGRWLLGCARG